MEKIFARNTNVRMKDHYTDIYEQFKIRKTEFSHQNVTQGSRILPKLFSSSTLDRYRQQKFGPNFLIPGVK